MFLPSRMPGRWSMKFASSGVYDMTVDVCWDGERITFWEAGKPHYISVASVGACTEWYYHGPDFGSPCLGLEGVRGDRG